MKSFKKHTRRVILIFVLLLFTFCLANCGANGEDLIGNDSDSGSSFVDIKSELAKWAMTTTETVNYYDYYYASADIVSVGGNDFLPVVKIVDSKNNGVALVSDKFLIEDKGGYSVTYIVVYNSESYQKQVKLNVVIASPSLYMNEMGDCYVGVSHDIPYIIVKENDGKEIDHYCKIFDSDNTEIEIKDGKFLPKKEGKHYLNVYAQGENGKSVEFKNEFTVSLAPQNKDFIMENSEKVLLLDTNNLILKTSEVSKDANSVKYGDVADAKMIVGKDYCIQLNCLSDPYSYVTFDLYVGDVSDYGYLEMEFWTAFYDGIDDEIDDNYYTWHLFAGEKDGIDLATYKGWRGWDNPVIIYIPAAYVKEGKLRLSFVQEYFGIGELYIQYVKGIVNQFKGLPEISSKASVGDPIGAEVLEANVCFQIQSTVMVTNLTPSVTFNGETVTLPYTATEKGTLVIVYEFCGLQYEIDVAVAYDSVTLVDNDNLISKTTLVESNATVSLGDSSDCQYNTEKASCIKLGSTEYDYSAQVTFDIDVGEVSAYERIEINFWALGFGGDTWYLKSGGFDGTVLFSAEGWRGWDDPVTVYLDTTAVVDGKLRLTFQQTWGVGDELYIRYISGHVKTAFVAELPQSFIIGSEIEASDYIADLKRGDTVLAEDVQVSYLKFNGDPVDMHFTPNDVGVLTFVYEYNGFVGEINVNVVGEVTLVDKNSLVSKLSVVDGVASIGTAEGLTGEASYCIKLDKSWASYTATIRIYVGDVSAFDHLEMKVWILGIGGDTCYVKTTGGDVLWTATSWTNDYNNAAVFDIPTSLVSDGYLYLTLQETWMTGDEFYIQYIKGII